MKQIKLLLIVAVFSIILISGCGGECKVNSECNDGRACTQDKCIDRECRHQSIPGCHIGNGVCEDGSSGTQNLGEDGCNAPGDCAPCFGNAGEYLTKKCNADMRCITELKDIKPTKRILSESFSDSGGPKLAATYSFEEPFNVDVSTFNIKIEIESISADISKVFVEKIQVYEKERTGTKIYGEKLVERNLIKGADFFVGVPIVDAVEESLDAKKKFTAKIFYTFDKSTRSGVQKISVEHEKSMDSETVLVNPSKERECPACSDGNDCTADLCSKDTNYFCEYKPKTTSCCGNYKCDSNENECTCPQDCGECERDYGAYMSYACVSQKCNALIRAEDVIKPKTLIQSMNLGGFQIDAKTTFDEPFDITSSYIEVELELKTIGSLVENMVCSKLRLTDGNVLLGEKDTSIAFTTVGGVGSEIVTPDFVMREPEETKKPTLTVMCEYDQKGVHQTKTGTQSLGSLVFLNPD